MAEANTFFIEQNNNSKQPNNNHQTNQVNKHNNNFDHLISTIDDSKNILWLTQLKTFYEEKRSEILDKIKDPNSIPTQDITKSIMLTNKTTYFKMPKNNTPLNGTLKAYIAGCYVDLHRSRFYSKTQGFFDIEEFSNSAKTKEEFSKHEKNTVKFLNEKVFKVLYTDENYKSNLNNYDTIYKLYDEKNKNNNIIKGLNDGIDEKKFNELTFDSDATINTEYKKLFYNLSIFHQSSIADITLNLFLAREDKNIANIYGCNNWIVYFKPQSNYLKYFDGVNNLLIQIGFIDINITTESGDFVGSPKIGKFIKFNELNDYENEYGNYLIELDFLPKHPSISIKQSFIEYFKNIFYKTYNINVINCLCSDTLGNPYRITKDKLAYQVNYYLKKNNNCGYNLPGGKIDLECTYNNNLVFNDAFPIDIKKKVTTKPCRDITSENIFYILQSLITNFTNIATSIILVSDITTIKKLLPILNIHDIKQYDVIEIQNTNDTIYIILYKYEQSNIYKYDKIIISLDKGKSSVPKNLEETNERLKQLKLPTFHRYYFFCVNDVPKPTVVDTYDPSLTIDEFITLVDILKIFHQIIKESIPIFFTSYLFKHQLIASLLNESLNNIRKIFLLYEIKYNINSLCKILINIFLLKNKSILQKKKNLKDLNLLLKNKYPKLNEYCKLEIIALEKDSDALKIISDLINQNPGEDYNKISFLESANTNVSGGSHYNSKLIKYTKGRYNKIKAKHTKGKAKHTKGKAKHTKGKAKHTQQKQNIRP